MSGKVISPEESNMSETGKRQAEESIAWHDMFKAESKRLGLEYDTSDPVLREVERDALIAAHRRVFDTDITLEELLALRDNAFRTFVRHPDLFARVRSAGRAMMYNTFSVALVQILEKKR